MVAVKRRRSSHSISTQNLSTISQATIAAQITAEDMQVCLQHLAQNGRRDDCLALMRELGCWQSQINTGSDEIFAIPYLGTDLTT